MVDSGDDPDIDAAWVNFGPNGYYVFFRTLEIMSREFDFSKPGILDINLAVLRRKYRTKWSKTAQVLSFYAECNRFKINYKGSGKHRRISIECPKLKGLCDEYTRQKLTKISGDSHESLRHVEVEVEVDNTLKKYDSFTLDYLKLDEFKNGDQKKIYRDISRVADLLIEKSIFKNVHSFVNKYDINGNNPKAILHALVRCYVKKIRDNPFGYCRKVFEKENPNYNELDYIQNQKSK